MKTKTPYTHHIQWHHYLISMHWFFPLFTPSLEHKTTVTATQCIILPFNTTEPYNNLSFAMSLATNEKNLGLNASKTQPSYSTAWNKSLTLKAGANSLIPAYDSPYLKMAAQTFLMCTTPIAACPSCQVQLLGQSTHAQAHCILLPLAHCSSLTSSPPSCCRKFTRQALFLLLKP